MKDEKEIVLLESSNSQSDNKQQSSPLDTIVEDNSKRLSDFSFETNGISYRISGEETINTQEELGGEQTSSSLNEVENKVSSNENVSINDFTHFISLLRNETFESGISNPSENYFISILEKDRLAALNCISNLFLENYNLKGDCISILLGILHLLSHLNYWEIYPIGQMIAMNALSHKNNEVAEFGIKCFENWGEKRSIGILKTIQYKQDWLQDYANMVIKSLE